MKTELRKHGLVASTGRIIAAILVAGCANTSQTLHQRDASLDSSLSTKSRIPPRATKSETPNVASISTTPTRRKNAPQKPNESDATDSIDAVGGDMPQRFSTGRPYWSDANFFQETEGTWRAVGNEKPKKYSENLPSTPNEQTLIGYRIHCTYRPNPGSEMYRSLSFWYKKRPSLDGLDISKVHFRLGKSGAIDLAVDACPNTWADAWRVVYGSNDGWNKYTAAIRAVKEKNAADQLASAQRQEKENAKLAEDWRQTVIKRPLNSDLRDLELAQKIVSDTQEAVRNREQLSSLGFQRAIDNDWAPRIDALAGSMLVKLEKIPVTPGGRSDFENWDTSGGGAILLAIETLRKIQEHRNAKGLSLKEALSRDPDAALKERDSWGLVNFKAFSAIKIYYIDAYRKRLANQQILGREFMRRVADDLDRLRPIGDPGLKVPKFQPFEKKESWLMTPEEQAQQNMFSDVGMGIANMIGTVGELTRNLEKLNVDVTNSRSNFWQCYKTNCNEAGKSYYAYSYALMAKDQHFLLSELTFAHSGVSAGLSFVGGDDVDGGLPRGCNREISALKTALSNTRKNALNDPSNARKAFADIFQGSLFRQYEDCRDLMEYIYRPRSFMRGNNALSGR